MSETINDACPVCRKLRSPCQLKDCGQFVWTNPRYRMTLIKKKPMSLIYLISSPQREFAVKCFSPSFQKDVQKNRSHFENEITFLKKIKTDPFVVRLFSHAAPLLWDIMEHQIPYFVMEYFPYTLVDVIKEPEEMTAEPFPRLLADDPIGFRIDLLILLLKALSVLQTRRIVHNDIKPSNILLRGFKNQVELVVADFDLARNEEELGDCAGTENYISPEQEQELPLSCQSDLWAIGTLIYKLFGQETSEGQQASFRGSSRLLELAEQCHQVQPKDRPGLDLFLSEVTRIQEEYNDFTPF